ncbi:flavoprotein [Russula earlei]|uniref:Flavoprotein n=1 Tax=Russula earlei TaxID=71964 RepID=A0ACC0UN07_9AGAM|nr:flavoprotein [Russula earlei]
MIALFGATGIIARRTCPFSALKRPLATIGKRAMTTAKTIAVLDQEDLKDGQMKEVQFDSGKVLLSRLGDKVHATSAFCTHYGAPLVKGVLTADGRVVCPWHGACFNICTGDIEDAPAPAALHSFQTHITDGKIYVTADPANTTKDKLSRPPKLLSSGGEVGGAGVVIVGGGSGAFHATESLREHGYKAPITIISQETNAPIDRTKLSKALITDASKLEWRTPADLKIKYGTTLRIGTTVTSVDTSNKTVTIENGKEILPYDTLILASGSVPRRLPIEGADLESVCTFRNVQDTQKIESACQEGKHLVVIGSSFISMELVGAVSKRNLALIHVIGLEQYPFEAVLGKEIGAGLKQFHQKQGVLFHSSTSVKAMRKDPGETLTKVELSNGATIYADLIVMGVGVRPATDYLKKSGWELEKDGSVKVDELLRVPDRPDVYAIGDIATYPQLPGGTYRRIEHWNVAGNMGRAVGKTIAGSPQPFVKVPIFWSAQGQQLRYCGIDVGHDDIYIQGDPAELKFIAYYIKGGKVTAVASMQNDPVVSKASELFRLGLMPSVDTIKAGQNLLDIDVSSVAANIHPK